MKLPELSGGSGGKHPDRTGVDPCALLHIYRRVGTQYQLGGYCNFFPGRPGRLFAGCLALAAGQANRTLAADSGSADSMGGGILLCLVYVPASQTGPVDGPGDRHVWRLEYRIPHRSKACGSLRPVFSRSHGCEWEIPLTAFAKRRIIGDSNRKRRNRSCRKRTRPTG